MVKVISIQKRGKVYQYRFEAARVNVKRKQITKSGFKTKNAAFIAGQKAYEDYQNGGCKVEGYMSYGDYLDYWLENYCKVNLKQTSFCNTWPYCFRKELIRKNHLWVLQPLAVIFRL